MVICSSPQCQSTAGCVCGSQWPVMTPQQFNTQTFTHEFGCPYLTAAGGAGKCTCTPEQKEIKSLKSALLASQEEAEMLKRRIAELEANNA